ncbi:MAG: hypothetical protein WCW14_02195 [Candidatus Paceibacterota bacterium]|jgi:hypothetical protein
MDEIKDEKLNTGINEIKNIKMTDLEKSHILQSILGQEVTKSKPIRSPWFNFSSMFGNSPYLRLAVYFILILAGGGIIVTTTNNNNERALSPQVDLYKSLNTFNSGQKDNDVPPKNLPGEIASNIRSSTPSESSDGSVTGATSSSLSFGMSPTAGIANTNSINYIEIASQAFTKYLEQEKYDKGYIIDYKIDEIVYMAAKKTANDTELQWFNTNNSNEAFIMRINYATKTTDTGTERWPASKSSYVTIDKTNGIYTVVSIRDNL